ncbi:MAG: hypothetical protein J6386_17485 [Candidatus Synoicihabitans palmerolidicus]|nr:hypothetical protein [Candidatus Synoicihabitans palmerolidicus]
MQPQPNPLGRSNPVPVPRDVFTLTRSSFQATSHAPVDARLVRLVSPGAPPLSVAISEDAPTRSTHPAHYRLRIPVSAPPEQGFRPTAINDRGDIIGAFTQPARFEAAAFQAHGVHLPANHESPCVRTTTQNAWPFLALSSNGLIAGTNGENASANRAWASHLGNFGEQFWPGAVSSAQAINAAGLVVGKTLLPAEPLLIFRAFVIGTQSRPRFLTPPEGGMTDAVAVNDEGTVLINVTSLAKGPPRQRAWLWQDGRVRASRDSAGMRHRRHGHHPIWPCRRSRRNRRGADLRRPMDQW